MAANFNKVILIGNLTRDVELRHTASNQAVARLAIACNRRWRTPDGEQREEAMFIDCEAWGSTFLLRSLCCSFFLVTGLAWTLGLALRLPWAAHASGAGACRWRLAH